MRRARRTPARAQRPSGRSPVPAGSGGELPGAHDAPRQGLGRLDRHGHRRHARSAHRADRRSDHRRRPARRGPPARDGRVHGRDPASHWARGEAGRHGRTPRIRVAVERVADRGGRPRPRAGLRARSGSEPAAPARRSRGVSRRRRGRRLGGGATSRRRRVRSRRSRASSPSSRRRPSTPSTDCRIARSCGRRLSGAPRSRIRARRPPTSSCGRSRSSASRRP